MHMVLSHCVCPDFSRLFVGKINFVPVRVTYAQYSLTPNRTGLFGTGSVHQDSHKSGRHFLRIVERKSIILEASLSTSSGIPRSGVQHINHILPVVYRPEAESSKPMAVQGDIFFATGNQNKLKEVKILAFFSCCLGLLLHGYFSLRTLNPGLDGLSHKRHAYR